MSSIDTMAGLKDFFCKTMADFEAKLESTKVTPTDTTSLAIEFGAFKTFVCEAFGILQKQMQLVTKSIDNMETRNRNGILLLHGVPEEQDENTAQVVVKVITNRLLVSDFSIKSIKRCHRMGRPKTKQQARPILFELQDDGVKHNIWRAKTKLKATGITVSEFLTKARHDLFMAARKKLGINRCWTRNGSVYVLGLDGTRHRLVSVADLDAVVQCDAASSATTVAAEKPVTSRPKRAAATKK